MGAERERKVGERAYHLWVEGGREHGKSDEHWHEAAQEIDAAKERKSMDRKAAKSASADGKAAERSKKTGKPKGKKKADGGSGAGADAKAAAKPKTPSAKLPGRPSAKAAPKPATPGPSRPQSAKAPRANGAARGSTATSGGQTA